MERDDLLTALRRLSVETGSLACMGCGHEHGCGVKGCAVIRDALAYIAELEAKVPKKGHWIGTSYDGDADGYPVYDEWERSECGDEHAGDADTLPDYCPGCGADMREDTNE